MLGRSHSKGGMKRGGAGSSGEMKPEKAERDKEKRVMHLLMKNLGYFLKTRSQ